MIEPKLIDQLKKLQPTLRKEQSSEETLANNSHFIANANRMLAGLIGALEGHNKHGTQKGKTPPAPPKKPKQAPAAEPPTEVPPVDAAPETPPADASGGKTGMAAALVILCLLLGCYRALAGVFNYAGSGVTINSQSTNIFSANLYQVGSVQLSAQSLYLMHGTSTNTNNFIVSYVLTIDGTNFFPIPAASASFIFSALGPQTNVPWTVSNVNLPLYGTIQAANTNFQNMTNFSASGQN